MSIIIKFENELLSPGTISYDNVNNNVGHNFNLVFSPAGGDWKVGFVWSGVEATGLGPLRGNRQPLVAPCAAAVTQLLQDPHQKIAFWTGADDAALVADLQGLPLPYPNLMRCRDPFWYDAIWKWRKEN